MNKAVVRHRDTGETINGLMQEILVFCPRCHSCARITVRPGATLRPLDSFTPRRVVCPACGYVKEWEGHGLRFDSVASPMRDSYFSLPLWLQTRCCGHVLWAYNRSHLRLMEQHIAASLREHRPDAKTGWRNHSLVGRLPEWMIIAKHRRAVLHGIEKLKRHC